jgi:hypothetical protein
MTLILSGTNGLSDVDGDASTPAVRGTDANSGIFFGADQVGVATNGVERVEFGNSETVFNDGGADVDFRVEGDTDANLLFVDASADAVGIGTAPSSLGKLSVDGNFVFGPFTRNEADTRSIGIFTSDDPASNDRAAIGFTTTAGGSSSNSIITFSTNDYGVSGGERARITSGGILLVGKTASGFGTVGIELNPVGAMDATRSAGTPLGVNRLANDGTLVELAQDNVVEGTISVSGGTVSYNPFLGSHSGALVDWSRPEIKIGTVMDTIDELLEYKVVVIDVQEEVPAKEAVLDEEGNEVEPAQEATTQTVQKRISYNGNGAVGSTATVEYEGQEYTGTIQHEREEPLSFNKHLKVKVNDTAASKAVFGVFVGWNNDSNNDGGVYNDMLVGAVGNYVIRMAAGQEPQIGDLVEADGNGCAVVQDDDIIRTKTIAKVTSTIKQVTYDDGSFLVTCVLYCG